MMPEKLRTLLVGRPMYEPLYPRIAEFEEREGIEVEVFIAPTHPKLNEPRSYAGSPELCRPW